MSPHFHLLRFDDVVAQAWFRASMHRASVHETPAREDTLLTVRDVCYDVTASLSERECRVALEAVRGRVGPENSPFYESRMAIVNQLKEIAK